MYGEARDQTADEDNAQPSKPETLYTAHSLLLRSKQTMHAYPLQSGATTGITL
jgi:hypothetical protein